jgi:hypothetical protein
MARLKHETPRIMFDSFASTIGDREYITTPSAIYLYIRTGLILPEFQYDNFKGSESQLAVEQLALMSLDPLTYIDTS